MAATSQSQAVAIANNLIGIAQSLYGLQTSIQQATGQFTQLTLATPLGAMATTAVNTDGSLGTADATPVSGHVIDTRVITSLNRAVSATTIESLVTLLQAVNTLLSGSTVSQQGQAPQVLAQLSGG